MPFAINDFFCACCEGLLSYCILYFFFQFDAVTNLRVRMYIVHKMRTINQFITLYNTGKLIWKRVFIFKLTINRSLTRTTTKIYIYNETSTQIPTELIHFDYFFFLETDNKFQFIFYIEYDGKLYLCFSFLLEYSTFWRMNTDTYDLSTSTNKWIKKTRQFNWTQNVTQWPHLSTIFRCWNGQRVCSPEQNEKKKWSHNQSTKLLKVITFSTKKEEEEKK